MNLMLIQFLVFSSVLLLVLGLNALRHQSRAQTLRVNRPGLFGWFPEEIAAVGEKLEPSLSLLFPGESKRIHQQLVAAALDGPLKPRDVRGLQGLLGFSLFALVLMFLLVVTLNGAWSLLGGVMFGLTAFYWPLIWLRRTAQARQDQISKDLPYAIDLLTVAMEAGQDLGAAIRHFVETASPGPLRIEFGIMLREMDLSVPRVDAMRSMAARMQVEEFKAVVTAVVQGSEMGASVATVLKIQADDIRRARFHRAERKAARTPSLMLIPMALFIVPAVFIVILTPVIMQMIDTMHRAR